MAAKDKDKDKALKRLGGGRWQTRDGRFTIEPQGGSWVVVDAEQTDDLGLPLVRGPFGSLGAAREAIDGARTDEAPVSPLAGRLEEAAERPRPARERPTPARRAGKGPAASSSGRTRTTGPATPAAGPARPAPTPPPPPAPPPPPPEPAWIGGLHPAERTGARALIARLEAAGVADAADVARREIVDGEPAVARLAVRQAIAAAVAEGGGTERVVARVTALLGDGGDDALGVRWRLVDEDGREIGDASDGA
jgi:hypothetical protein